MTDYAVDIERDGEGRAARLAFRRVGAGPDMPQGVDAAGQGVTPRVAAQAAILRCICGASLEGRKGAHCSRRCKDRAYNAAHPVSRQRSLPLEPAPVPLPPVRDQRVPRERRRTLSGASLRIYRRLQAGPVSNWELAGMFRPATAWRTRLSDVRWALRAADGLPDEAQPIGSHDAGHGLVWHWLEGA